MPTEEACITLHSFTRFVKSNLGYGDFSEYFIGHSGFTYYRKTEKEIIEIFRKIEPHLTYLDYPTLEQSGITTLPLNSPPQNGATSPLTIKVIPVVLSGCGAGCHVGLEYARVVFSDSSNPSNNFGENVKITNGPFHETTFDRDVLIGGYYQISISPLSSTTTHTSGFFDDSSGQCLVEDLRGRSGFCGAIKTAEPTYVEIILQFFVR